MELYKAELQQKDIEVWNLYQYLNMNADEVDIDETVTALVYFRIEFECRSWGIKGITVTIDRVEINIFAHSYNDEGDIIETTYLEINTAKPEWKDFKIVEDIKCNNSQLSIEELIIDFKDKTIKLE